MSPLHAACILLFLFALGACLGSFLNVCAHRLPRGLSLVRPGSQCPRCRKAIAFRDNLPVLGWIVLKGKCRQCRAPISPRYPLVEATVGALLAAVFAIPWLAGVADPTEVGPLQFLALMLTALVSISGTVGYLLVRWEARRPHRHYRVDSAARLIPATCLGRIGK